jgi:hypothetical protein
MFTRLFIFFSLLFSVAKGEQVFLVYQLKGSVKLKENGLISSLRIGQVLNSGNSITIARNSSVVLICEGYRVFTIKREGVHKLKGFIDSCTPETHSITARYFEFIWDEFTHPHSTPEGTRRKYMQNAGAVVRGCPGIKFEPIFDTIYNSNGNIWISWETALQASQISFVMFNSESGGTLLYTCDVAGNGIYLDSIKNHMGKYKEVYWNLTINGNEMCSRKYIEMWDKSDYDSLFAECEKQLKEISDRAERNYATGFVLEQNHFIAEARGYYRKATEIKPSESRYRNKMDFMELERKSGISPK